jgi:hypothetical protein
MKPGDFTLGSPQSRAAARAFLASKRATEGEGTLIRVLLVGSPPEPGRRCTCPWPPAGTFALCKCFYEAGDSDGAETNRKQPSFSGFVISSASL